MKKFYDRLRRGMKREYEIKLVLPARMDLFDASISDKRGDEKSV